jgi:hypothetical protein
VDEIGLMHPTGKREFDTREDKGLDQKVEEQLRKVAVNHTYAGTEAGQFLNWYWERRDPIFQRMMKTNNSSLYNPSSKNMRAKWEAELAYAFEVWPDGERLYNTFLRDDLYGRIDTHGTKVLDELGRNSVALAETGTWEADWGEALGDAKGVNQASNPAEAERAFVRLKKLSQHATQSEWTFRLNPQEVWWETQTKSSKQHYLEGVRGRPALYWSAFDRQKLGIKSNKAAEEAWINVSTLRAQISQYRQGHPGIGVTPTTLYQAADVMTLQAMQGNPVFRKQVEIANTWGWGLEHSGLTEGDTNAAEAWGYVFDYVHSIQKELTRLSATGEKDTEPGHKAIYQAARDELEAYLEEAAARNSLFKSQLRDQEKINGSTPLAYQLIPDAYFPLGGFAFAKEMFRGY